MGMRTNTYTCAMDVPGVITVSRIHLFINFAVVIPYDIPSSRFSSCSASPPSSPYPSASSFVSPLALFHSSNSCSAEMVSWFAEDRAFCVSWLFFPVELAFALCSDAIQALVVCWLVCIHQLAVASVLCAREPLKHCENAEVNLLYGANITKCRTDDTECAMESMLVSKRSSSAANSRSKLVVRRDAGKAMLECRFATSRLHDICYFTRESRNGFGTSKKSEIGRPVPTVRYTPLAL